MRRALPFLLAIVFTGVCLTVGEINRRDAQAIVDRQHARIEQLQLRNGELYASVQDWKHKAEEIEREYLTCAASVPHCLPGESGAQCQARIGDTGRYEVIEGPDGQLRVESKP